MKKSEFKAQRDEKRNVSVEGVEADVITLHGIKSSPNFSKNVDHAILRTCTSSYVKRSNK